jgi:hypothetical protein
MIRTLMALVAKVTRTQPPLTELAGAVAVTVGVTQWFGGPAGWIAAGVALLLKSAETPPAAES